MKRPAYFCRDADCLNDWLPDGDFFITLALFFKVGKSFHHKENVAVAKKQNIIKYIKTLNNFDDIRPFYIWPSSGQLSFVVSINEEFEFLKYQ